MSKNISNLSGRIGLKDNLFKKMSENVLNDSPKDIKEIIGEPYIKSKSRDINVNAGTGLGTFIGKTLLEKNFASINCRNSKTRSGAEVIVKWKNKDLFNV